MARSGQLVAIAHSSADHPDSLCGEARSNSRGGRLGLAAAIHIGVRRCPAPSLGLAQVPAAAAAAIDVQLDDGLVQRQPLDRRLAAQ